MKQIKNLFVICLVLFCTCFLLGYNSYATTYKEAVSGKVSKEKINSAKSSIDKRRANTRQKIKELKIKENREISKLYKSQGNLEVTKKELQTTTQDLEHTKSQLSQLQTNLDQANAKYNRDQIAIGNRLREIYKGERLSFINVLFMAENINVLLDKIYFQQLIAKKDTDRLIELKAQLIRLTNYTNQIEQQKRNILYTMAKIQSKKDKIAQDINTSQYLIKKLQTDRKTYEQSERELARQSDRLAQMLRGSSKSAKFTTTTGFLRPVGGPITSPFGWRKHPIFGSRTFHSGIDIGAAYGTPVRASNSGVVVYSGWYGGYGKVIIINHGSYHGKPTSTLYAHLSRYSVSNGAKVSKGQVIGHIGSTGYSTGPHLHFEVRLNGNPVNPLNYVR